MIIDDLVFLIYRHETGLSEELARNNWTAKHFKDKTKVNSYPLAEKIMNYIRESLPPKSLTQATVSKAWFESEYDEGFNACLEQVKRASGI